MVQSRIEELRADPVKRADFRCITRSIFVFKHHIDHTCMQRFARTVEAGEADSVDAARYGGESCAAQQEGFGQVLARYCSMHTL